MGEYTLGSPIRISSNSTEEVANVFGNGEDTRAFLTSLGLRVSGQSAERGDTYDVTFPDGWTIASTVDNHMRRTGETTWTRFVSGDGSYQFWMHENDNWTFITLGPPEEFV